MTSLKFRIMAGWARAAPGGTAGSFWGGERTGQAPLHSTSACSTASPVVFCPHALFSLPSLRLQGTRQMFFWGRCSHVNHLRWQRWSLQGRKAFSQPCPQHNSKPLPPKNPRPWCCPFFWLNPISISHEYFNNLLDGKKSSVMRSTLESPRINWLIIQIGGGGLVFDFFS